MVGWSYQTHIYDGMGPGSITGPLKRWLGINDTRTNASEKSQWYVSYAWGDTNTSDGLARGKIVDDLCALANIKGHKILRDKEVLSVGSSIVDFMKSIGSGDRIFVILSDKYLRSPHCMFELNEIWRTSSQDRKAFLERVRVFALPGTKITSPSDWADWAIHWQSEHEALESRVRQHGTFILGEIGLRRLKQMHQFCNNVPDILGTFSEIVQPRTLDELSTYGFADK